MQLQLRLVSQPGAHSEILKGGVNFPKKQPDPILVNLLQPLMKMHGIIVHTGFRGNSGILLQLGYFENHVITILKVVGCEDCEQKNKLPLWGPGREAPSRWAILGFFFFLKKKQPF